MLIIDAFFALLVGLLTVPGIISFGNNQTFALISPLIDGVLGLLSLFGIGDGTMMNGDMMA